MLPSVPMQRRVSSGLYREMSHCEGWGADRLVEQPLDLDAFRALFLDHCVFLNFNVDLVEGQRDHWNEMRRDLADKYDRLS